MPELALLVSHPFNKVIKNHRPCLIRIIIFQVWKTYLPKVKKQQSELVVFLMIPNILHGKSLCDNLLLDRVLLFSLPKSQQGFQAKEEETKMCEDTT